MRVQSSDERLITTGGVAVLAASLALVATGSRWRHHARQPCCARRAASAVAALLVPGAVGVWAAWLRRPVVAWVVAALFVTVWVWRQLPPVVAVVPVLSLAAAALVTLTTRRAAHV